MQKKSKAQQRLYRAVAFGAKGLMAMTVWMTVYAASLFAQPLFPTSGNISGTYLATGGVNYVGPYTMTGSVTIIVPDGYAAMINGVINGSNSNYSLTKLGPNNLTLTAANTYTGKTIINEGNFILNGGSITNSSGVEVNGGVFNITSGNKTINNLSGSSSSATISLGSGTLTINQTTALSFNGVISGSGGITKSGSAILTLNGNNTYSGTTTISNSSSLTLGASGSITNSRVYMNTSSTLNISASKTIKGLSSTTTATSAKVTLNGYTLTVNQTAAYSFYGVISGSGGLTLTGTSVLRLCSANTYTGTTTINSGAILFIGDNTTTGSVAGSIVNNGTLRFYRSNNITYDKIISGSGIVSQYGSGTLTFTGNNTYTGTTYVLSGNGTIQIGNNGTTGAIAGGINIASGCDIIFARSNAYTYNGIISGAGDVYINVGGSAPGITFGNANTYTGHTTISGKLILNSTGKIENSAYVMLNGATLDISAADKTIKNLVSWSYTNNGEVILGSRTLTINMTGNEVFDGKISGTGGITKTGTYNLTLGGANTYTGLTTISAGTLILSTSGTIATSSGVTLSGSGKLDISAGNKTIKALNSSSSSSSVVLSNRTLTLGTSGGSDGGGTFTGIFSGTGGSVTKQGSASFTMNTANTATGTFTASQGTVVLSGNWAGNFVKNSGSTLTVTGNRTISGTLNMQGGTTNFNLSSSPTSRLSATGALTKSGTNTLNITAIGSSSSYVLLSAASGVNTTNFTVTGSNGTLSATSTQLTFTPAPTFVPVTNITGVPTTATAFLPLTLTGTVVPSDATNKTITWSVSNAGGTGANITGGNVLNTTNSGTATIIATVVNGLSPTSNYTQSCTITVTKASLAGTVTVNGDAVFEQTLAAVTTGLTSSPVIPALGTLSYQWQRGTTNISGATSSTYTLVQADIGNTIRVVVSAANCNGSVTSASTATVTKATPNAPAAPTMLSATSTSITLNSVAGCEYRRDANAWQDNTTFTGLTASTPYSFTQRYKETATHFASPESPSETFTTGATEFTPVTDITGVPNITTAFMPLTLTATVVPADATNKTIVWSVDVPGTTGATIASGTNILNTTGAGTATVKATIVNGESPTTPFVKTFNITVVLAELGGTVSIEGAPVFGSALNAGTTELTSTPDLPDLGALSYQWQRNGNVIAGATAASYTLVAADINAVISVTVSAAHCSGSVTSPSTDLILKADQAQPPAPTLANITATTITLNTLAGCEYSRDGSAWQPTPLFAGLYPETTYSFTQRYAETNTHYASPDSPGATFTTTAGSNLHIIKSSVNNPAYGSINPDGEAPVEQGNSITFYITAYDGFHIEEVLVDGVNNPNAVATGSYTFNNVNADHEIHVVFEEGVGITAPPSPPEGGDVRVYPNPTSGLITICDVRCEICDIAVFDVMGKACNVSRVTCNENEMDISSLPTGVYFLRITTENGVVTKKVIKE